MIGDAILFYLDENKFNLVGRPPAANWVQYHVETGGYKASAERDERSAVNQGRRKTYRYQVQGPHALRVMEKVTGKPAPDIRFFHMECLQRRGPRASAPCVTEWWGSPDGNCLARGRTARRCATPLSKPVKSTESGKWAREPIPPRCLESGWIPSPLPAIYIGEEMKGYRQWLTPKSYEAMASLGGSFYSDDITDYYLTPYDLGYGPFVKFDHDFVGRAALEKMADNQRRKKVTLVWNGDDVARVFGSLFHAGRHRQVHRPTLGELFDAAV